LWQWAHGLLAPIDQYRAAAQWVGVGLSVASLVISLVSPTLRYWRRRRIADKLSELAEEAFRLRSRSVLSEAEYATWYIEFASWQARVYEAMRSRLPKAEAMNLRTMLASDTDFPNAFGPRHLGDLRYLEPRYLRVRELSIELVR
jgi:hypothetical protein